MGLALASTTAGLTPVYLVCSGAQCPPERWLGEYALAGEINGKPSYRHQDGASWLSLAKAPTQDVRTKQLAGDALLLQPMLWHMPRLGWFVGAPEHLGERRGSIVARDPAAPLPTAVSSVWTTALGTSNGSAPMPNLLCLAHAEGSVAVAAAVAAKRAIVSAGAGTVFFAPQPSEHPRLDRLRASWAGQYRRIREPAGQAEHYWIVNDRQVYECLTAGGSAGGASDRRKPRSLGGRALWYAGDSWFVGFKEHAGQPRGVFYSRDAALLPERIRAEWQVAGSALTKPLPGLGVGTGLGDWLAAPDLGVLAGEAGKQALTRYKAETALRGGTGVPKGSRRKG